MHAWFLTAARAVLRTAAKRGYCAYGIKLWASHSAMLGKKLTRSARSCLPAWRRNRLGCTGPRCFRHVKKALHLRVHVELVLAAP